MESRKAQEWRDGKGAPPSSVCWFIMFIAPINYFVISTYIYHKHPQTIVFFAISTNLAISSGE